MVHYYKSFDCIDEDNIPHFNLFVFDDLEADRLPAKKDWTQFFLNLHMNEYFAQNVDPIEIAFEEFQSMFNQTILDMMGTDNEEEYAEWFIYPSIYRDYENDKIITMPSAFFYEMPSDYLSED